MKRAATIGLAMTLITLNACIFSSPAMAEGLLTDLVKDTLGTAAGIVGGVVGGAAGITSGVVGGAADITTGVVGGAANVTSGVVGGAAGVTSGVVRGAADIVTGTVDATGAVVDTTGHVVGRVLVGPGYRTTTTATVVPGWTTVTPTTATTLIPGTTVSTERIYTFGPGTTVFGATFDTRISDLRRAIAVAEANGKISASQAADFRARLDRISTSWVTASSTSDFGFNGAIAIARDLDTFNNDFATTLSVRPFTPLIVTQNGTDRILVTSAVIPSGNTYVGNTTGGVGGVVGGVINGVGNIVGGALNAVGGVVGGTLSTAGGVVGSAVTASGDVIDSTGRVIGSVVPGTYETAVPSGGSSRVIIGTTTNVLSTNIDLRMADMRRLVAEYQIGGRITPMQAAEITAMLDNTATQLASRRVSGRTLTFDEAISLARDLDNVNVRMGSFIGSNPFSPMVVVEQGSPRMMIITKNGVLTPPVPGNTVIGTTTGITTGGPTVIGTIPGTISTSPIALLPILDQRRLEFDRLIANALSNRAISSAEAARLQADLNDITNRMVAANAAGASFSVDSVTTLARILDDFNIRLATAIHGSPLTPLTVIGSNGLPVLSTTVFTNVVGLPAVQPTTWFTTLTDRRTLLESMIASGIAAGTIGTNQATELRAELARIAAAIDAARASGSITYPVALPLAMNLDVLGNRIHTYAPTYSFVPLVSQGRITFVGGITSPIDDLHLRRAELGASIDREKALGRLTTNEAQRLQFELNNIGNREGRFMADGVLTYREVVQITNDLNRFQARLNNLVANRRATVSVR